MQPVMETKTAIKWSMPGVYLRIEGLVLFVGSILLFAGQGGSWLIFLVLLLTPDLAMLGYLVNKGVGAQVYNLVHNYLPPALLLLIGVNAANSSLIQLAAIWLAHIGMDRTVGYGLKYATAFKDSHLQRV